MHPSSRLVGRNGGLEIRQHEHHGTEVEVVVPTVRRCTSPSLLYALPEPAMTSSLMSTRTMAEEDGGRGGVGRSSTFSSTADDNEGLLLSNWATTKARFHTSNTFSTAASTAGTMNSGADLNHSQHHQQSEVQCLHHAAASISKRYTGRSVEPHDVASWAAATTSSAAAVAGEPTTATTPLVLDVAGSLRGASAVNSPAPQHHRECDQQVSFFPSSLWDDDVASYSSESGEDSSSSFLDDVEDDAEGSAPEAVDCEGVLNYPKNESAFVDHSAFRLHSPGRGTRRKVGRNSKKQRRSVTRARTHECSVLHTLLQGRKWNKVTERAKDVPQEIASYGNVHIRGGAKKEPVLAIHLACTLNPPVELITSLIDASSKEHATAEKTESPSSTLSNCACASDKNGRTALHWACDAGGCSPDVIKTLLKANPEAATKQENKYGYLPLHIACFHDKGGDDDDADEAVGKHQTKRKRRLGAAADVVDILLEAYPQGASVKDNMGWLPIHICCRTNVDGERVVRSLLRSYPEGARIRDGGSRLPLHWACTHRFTSEVGDHHRSNIDGPTCKPNDSGRSCPDPRDGAEGLVNALIEMYPKAAAKRERNHRFLPLHIACSSGASTRVIQALLRAYPDGARKQDRNGSLPVHIACRANASGEVVHSLLDVFADGAHFQDADCRLPLHWACHVDASSSKVSALLKAFAEGAQLTEAKYGYLPLHVAVKRGAPEDVIASLLTAFPEAAMTRDDGGNLPIHLAASSRGTPASVIGMLLLAFPESVERYDQEFRLPRMIVEEGDSPHKLEILRLLESCPSGWQRQSSFHPGDGDDSPACLLDSVSSGDQEASSADQQQQQFLALCKLPSKELLAALQKNEEDSKNNLLCFSQPEFCLKDSHNVEPSWASTTSPATKVFDPHTVLDADDDRQLIQIEDVVVHHEQLTPVGGGEEEESMLCVLCLERPVNYILYPCGHPCLCEGCARTHLSSLNNVCPVGRCDFRDAVRVYGKIVGS